MLYVGGFFIFVGVGSTVSRAQLMAACLHPAAAFTFGTLAFVEYEDAQIGVTDLTYNVSQTYAITFKDCLDMMIVDAIYLAALSWYFNNIWPSECIIVSPTWWSLRCCTIDCQYTGKQCFSVACIE